MLLTRIKAWNCSKSLDKRFPVARIQFGVSFEIPVNGERDYLLVAFLVSCKATGGVHTSVIIPWSCSQ